AGGVDPGPARVLRDQRHRALIRAAQKIVKNKNGEERIRCDGELERCGFLRCGADSVQPVEIEVHCDASIFDNHLLQRSTLAPGSSFCRGSTRDRVRRSKKQEQWKRETGEQ